MWLLGTVPLQHSQACVFSESHSARACDNWLVSGHISTGPIQRLPKRTCSTLLRSSSNLSWHDVFYNALAPWIPQGVGLGCTCRISCDLMFQFLKLVAKKWIHPADFSVEKSGITISDPTALEGSVGLTGISRDFQSAAKTFRGTGFPPTFTYIDQAMVDDGGWFGCRHFWAPMPISLAPLPFCTGFPLRPTSNCWNAPAARFWPETFIGPGN